LNRRQSSKVFRRLFKDSFSYQNSFQSNAANAGDLMVRFTQRGAKANHDRTGRVLSDGLFIRSTEVRTI